MSAGERANTVVPFLKVVLVGGHVQPLGLAGVDGRRPYKRRQLISVDNDAVKEWPKEGHFRLPRDGYAVEVRVCARRGQRVDDNEGVTKLGGQQCPPIFLVVLRPDNVHLVIAQVAHLLV